MYVPSTLTRMRDLVHAGVVGPAPITGFAVTPGLREWYLDDDLEELEYAAMTEAARACLRLLDDERLGGKPAWRRAVLAVDVADSEVEIRDDLDRGVVHIRVDVPLASVASAHVDDVDASLSVQAAAAAIGPADLGDPNAQEVVDDAEGFELSWYASQEIPALIELL